MIFNLDQMAFREKRPNAFFQLTDIHKMALTVCPIGVLPIDAICWPIYGKDVHNANGKMKGQCVRTFYLDLLMIEAISNGDEEYHKPTAGEMEGKSKSDFRIGVTACATRVLTAIGART